MKLAIRPATAQDWAAIGQAADEAVPFDPEGNRHWLQLRRSFDERGRLRRHYVVTEAGTVFGYGALEQQQGAARRLRVFVVLPPGRLADAGALLWQRLLADATELGAQTLWVREYLRDEAILAFFAGRGFRETSRLWDHRLAPAEARLKPFQPRLQVLQAAGFAVRSAQQAQQEDPDFLARLADLVVATHPAGHAELTVEAVAAWLDSPAGRPDTFFLALHGDEPDYAGYTFLTPLLGMDGRWAQQECLIRPEFRRQGLTLLLHAQAIRHAQEQGWAQLVTYTEDENFTLLALREKLGFQRTFCYVTLERTL